MSPNPGSGGFLSFLESCSKDLERFAKELEATEQRQKNDSIVRRNITDYGVPKRSAELSSESDDDDENGHTLAVEEPNTLDRQMQGMSISADRAPNNPPQQTTTRQRQEEPDIADIFGGVALAIGGAAALFFGCKYLFSSSEETRIVEKLSDCAAAVADLKRNCAAYKVLGFDCKWNNYPGYCNQKIAALQLCAPNGLCVIFRLCKLNCVPKCLKQLLEDDDIAKVSITPLDDAEKMMDDWNVNVRTTFDLRFLARKANIPPVGLKRLAKIVLNKDLDDELDVLATDWNTEKLSEEHIICAKSHAITSMELFKKMLNQMMKREVKQFDIWQSELQQYVDLGSPNFSQY